MGADCRCLLITVGVLVGYSAMAQRGLVTLLAASLLSAYKQYG